jgi:hypothetical protein
MPPAAIPGSKTGADSLCRGRISTSSDSGPLSSLDRAGRQDQSFATVCVIRPGSKPPKPVAQTRWPSVRGRARSRSSPMACRRCCAGYAGPRPCRWSASRVAQLIFSAQVSITRRDLALLSRVSRMLRWCACAADLNNRKSSVKARASAAESGARAPLRALAPSARQLAA